MPFDDASPCARRLRIMSVPKEHWLNLLRGTARIRNLPADASIVAATPVGDRVGFRVHSERFSPVPHGEPIPVVISVIEVGVVSTT